MTAVVLINLIPKYATGTNQNKKTRMMNSPPYTKAGSIIMGHKAIMKKERFGFDDLPSRLGHKAPSTAIMINMTVKTTLSELVKACPGEVSANLNV